jgi:hypothetical protein
VNCGLQLSRSSATKCYTASEYSSLQRIAGTHSSLLTLQAARDSGLEMASAVAQGAAETGSVAKLRWLHTVQDYLLSTETMNAAASTGQLHVCQYLRAEGCAWSERTCELAIIGDHTKLLRWLHESRTVLALWLASASAQHRVVRLASWRIYCSSRRLQKRQPC